MYRFELYSLAGETLNAKYVRNNNPASQSISHFLSMIHNETFKSISFFVNRKLSAPMYCSKNCGPIFSKFSPENKTKL